VTEDIVKLITRLHKDKLLIRAIFSSPRKLGDTPFSKVEIRPVEIKGALVYQLSQTKEQSIFHSNHSCDECQKHIIENLLPTYRQAVFFTKDADYHLLTGKKGNQTLLEKPATMRAPKLAHNREKQHILKEGTPLPFLCELGIMTASGRVLPQKRDKFLQINRFLEMVQDILPAFSSQSSLNIVDFGCGKAYLTFALFHFLQKVKNYSVTITGLDVKKELLASNQEIAERLGFSTLYFHSQDIAHYTAKDPIDIAVALHACNTATDAAIAKAIHGSAKALLIAPCCQNELYQQIESKPLDALLQHGILKERMAALSTDAARAQLLEMHGYTTQILEFIDAEHTPKNLLIRAVFGNTPARREKAAHCYQQFKEILHIKPSLERFLEL